MFTDKKSHNAITLVPILTHQLEKYLNTLTPKNKRWVTACGFKARSGETCFIHDGKGGLSSVLLGMKEKTDTEAFAKSVNKLPVAEYVLSSKYSKAAALAWGRAQYRFARYKKKSTQQRVLFVKKKDKHEINASIEAISLVRDLINTPAEDMGPGELADIMLGLAKRFDATFNQVVGESLLEKDYPAIYAVGRAAEKKPRLLELTWGEPKKPLVTLVGKGVCFDSGGLDIKPASNMLLMKKDMGGAAHVLGLAQLIMSMSLPIRLQVLIPAVENAISGNAYRPGDIVQTRKGLTVEVGNTDAEGRVVLADALCKGSESKPALMIDFATLTGAARIAVGTELAAMFSNDKTLAEDLKQGADNRDDPVWELPLFKPYLKYIQPDIADLSNTGSTVYGGAITAALFLEQFVGKGIPWAHFDIMAWNTHQSPGKPKGGEAMGLLAVYDMLVNRFSMK